MLFQLKPILFSTRFDLFTWLLMKTGIHRWLLNNPGGWLVFDITFYSMPFLHWLTYRKNLRLASIVAALMLVVNWLYIQCFTLYPTNSIEAFTPWLLFPILFMTVDLKNFYFIFHALRYFFLYFFVSAAVWKFVQEGIFNPQQMSAILLYHHKEYIASSPAGWYTSFTYWLINHAHLSYILYAGATLLELTFITGFFTRKFDKALAAGFIFFLLLDHFIMRIPYWEMSPFLLTLLYSKYSLPSIYSSHARKVM